MESSSIPGVLRKNYYTKQPHQSRSPSFNTNSDIFATPHPVVLNKGRKVKNSLQRLEKEQDELFEL